MNIQVRNASTLRNLDRLRSYVLRHPNEEKISVLIDPLTGEMSVPQNLQDFEFLIKKPRLDKVHHPEQARLFIHSAKSGVEFALLDEKDRERDLQQFSKGALLVVMETLKILNQLLGPSFHSAKELFAQMDFLEIEELGADIQMRPEWRASINRVEAEDLLEGFTVGTYLLREGDEATQEFEENLMKTNSHSFRLFVVTFVDDFERVSDRLLIQRSEGWAVYDDNPDLNAYTYRENLNYILAEVGAKVPISSNL